MCGVHMSVHLSVWSVYVRVHVGRLQSIKQPRYAFDAVDPHFKCKQDVDPTDFLGW